MGSTYATVQLIGPKGSHTVELLADTGSVYTWIARQTLERLGVESKGTRRFRTIEGREVTRVVGEAILALMGERATRIVVFAEEGDAQVLGADSLEGLGFEVDPTTKQLKRVESFIAY